MGENTDKIEVKLGEIDPVKAYILLLLRENDFEPVKGKLWLQKEMFIILSNLDKLRSFIDFEPYFFGPHSESVEVNLEQLVKSGLVKFEGSKILLTPLGKDVANLLASRASRKNLEIVREAKKLLNDLSKDELLALIYFTFPEMAKESLEIQNVKKRRKELALKLYKKGKVSLSKAAEISGLGIEDFINMLRKTQGRIWINA